LAAALLLLAPARALAAPERLADLVPDAVPDMQGALSFAWGREMLDLEGQSSERTARDYFKLRYTFSPKVAASFRYTVSDLAGGFGLVTPVYNDVDSAQAYTLDLGMNLMNVPRTPADPAKQVAFAAGSSFGIGVNGTQYKLTAGTLDQSEMLINAYLVYSTDLTEEMRAHTYFSSGRLSGDTHTGSVNRVGAGLDYALIPGRRPLELMADGVLDIYNFRQPSFNTSRISRFDVGLRYRVARDWYATIGWATVNDSENNNSGSGLMGGLNYVQMPSEKKPCPPVEEKPAEGQPAEGQPPAPPAEGQPAAPPPTASAAPEAAAQQQAAIEQPPLMANAGPSLRDGEADAAAGGEKTASAAPAATTPDAALAAAAPGAAPPGADTGPITGGQGVMSIEPPASSGPLSAGEDSGIVIPELHGAVPQQTAPGAIMLRAGTDLPPLARRHATASDVMLRPPVPAVEAERLGTLVADVLDGQPVQADAGTTDAAVMTGPAPEAAPEPAPTPATAPQPAAESSQSEPAAEASGPAEGTPTERNQDGASSEQGPRDASQAGGTQPGKGKQTPEERIAEVRRLAQRDSRVR
jgi:hypothetical protein